MSTLTPATGQGHSTRYENILLAVLCTSFGMVFWNRLALNYALPFVVADLRLNNAEAGLLVSALALSWAISGYVIGGLADRTGRRRALLVGLTLVFTFAGLASGLASSFGALMGMRLLMGAAQGPILPIAQAMMASESTPARRGLNMGLLQNLGSGLLAYIVAPVGVVAMAVAWGWRNALMASALPGLVLAAMIVLLVRRDPPQAAARAGLAPALRYIGERNIQLCLAATVLMVMWLMVQMTFLPGYMMSQLGFSPGEMALQLSLRGMSGLIGGIALPALSDRFGRRRVIITGAVLAAVSPLCAALPGQTFTTLALSGLIMGAGAGCLPLVMAIVPSETAPPAAAAAAMGLIMGFGELAGGFVAPVAVGLVADRLGPQAPFVMAGIAALLGAGLAYWLRDATTVRIHQPAA
ncbi:MFS transporter [Nitrospirillum sp. BR 11163]|uniref:MFS transporter n=1 Tax=Nitrospirillum sp. BR 11163 TaxID=3104323 RepID=UPI002AFF758E|nr:MFS transporter [Nitrospirillum sp. BR 11163]MEA1672785.1 MFS transporter [Nitrospirillum sp. BR 11163]